MHLRSTKVGRFGAMAVVAALAVAGLAATSTGASAGVVGTNLVSNGGFEMGVDPWTSPAGGTLSTDAEIVASGSASLKVSERTNTLSGPWQDLNGKLVPGSSYDISAKVRFDSGPESKEFIITMAYSDRNTNVARAVVTRGQWGEIEGSFTIPEDQDVKGARIYIETPWVPDPSADPAQHLMDFRVDDVSLFEVEPSFQWSSSDPVIVPQPNETHPSLAVKDPSVVFADGKYHVFMTTASMNGWHLATTSFADWSEAIDAPITYLADSPIGAGYTAAPQVFFFEPHGLWYLIYQGSDPLYSTTADIDDPMSWTAPRPMYPNGTPPVIQETGGWLDFYNVCDEELCHLFATGDNGRFWRAETSIEDFPNGFGTPELELQDTTENLFEASMTYKLDGSDKYVTMIEAIGRPGRYFRSWIADDLAGPWTPLAATESDPFAGPANRTFENEAWSKEQVSHGEMIRSGSDQHLTLDPCEPLRLLYQGVSHTAQVPEYVQLPYKLGLLTAVGDNPISDMCVDVESSVSKRTVDGKTGLVVSVTNNESSSVDLTVTTDFGAKTVRDLGPGKTTSVAFHTRLAEVPAGAITINATRDGSTGPVSYERTIEYVAGAGPKVAVNGIVSDRTYTHASEPRLGVTTTPTGSPVDTVVARIDGRTVRPGTIEMWQVDLGRAVLEVTATDEAGNTTTVRVPLTVMTSIAVVRTLVQRFADDGSMTRKVEARILGKLRQAATLVRRDRDRQAVAALRDAQRLAGQIRVAAHRAVVKGDLGAIIRPLR